jgi:thiol:disulfide interchange protein
MRRIFLFVIAPLFFIACNFLLPTTKQVENPLPAPQGLTSSTDPFVISRINKVNGDLMIQLASETKKANALGLSPFIEFDATWCPPCQAIEKSIKSKDPLTVKALNGVYLIRADVDEWGYGDGKNFKFDAIPVYYKLNDSGKPTGAVIDGGAWGEDIPENFAPVLEKFFHTQ